MVVGWMFYSLVVATALGLAAASAEPTVRERGLPLRGVWALATVLSVALAALAWWAPGSTGLVDFALGPATPLDAASGSAGARGLLDGGVSLSALLAAGLTRVQPMATLLWVAASALLAGRFAASALGLARSRRRWRPTRIAGTSVCVAHNTGPAVVGALRPVIVVPSWLLDEPLEVQSLIIRHEEEHVRGLDPWLVLCAFAAVVAMPWNAALWWQYGRLREAVELDCDRRVLRRADAATRRRYGALLLDVTAHLRTDAPRSALAAFAERGTALERRIRTMLHLLPPLSYPRRLALLLGTAGLVGLACAIPGPDGESPTGPTTETATSEIEADAPAATPRFTPYTKAPTITNRAEVQRLLDTEYPPLLRDAGIGGTSTVWLHIDEQGRVLDVRINRASGHESLDRAALRVAEGMRFEPGLNRDTPVAVWVSFPITFQVRSPGDGAGS